MTSRARHDRFALRAAVIWLAVSAILLAASLPAHAQISGTDCGCATTGDYVAPDPGVEPALAADDGPSPDGRFTVEITSLPGQIPATLDVVRVAGGVTLLSNVSGTSWGFSPDGDRFLISDSIGPPLNQQFEYQLYDLAAATAPMIWHTGPAPFDSVRPRFSADGAVFLFAATTGVFGTSLDLLEIASRSLYQPSPFHPAAPPTYLEDDADPSVSGWGFGPDPTRFVYGYVADQANGLKNVSLVNVHTRVANEVAFTAASLAAFFSPCGDVLAYKSKQLQLDETTELILYATRNPQPGPLGSESFEFSTVEPRSTATRHVGLLGGEESPMVPNVPNHAGDVCPIVPPEASFDAPTSPLAGELVAFTDTSTDSDGTVVAWSWDFGDGGTSTSRNPIYTYAESGTYTVTLTVTDDDGATDTLERDVKICGTTTSLSGKILVDRNGAPSPAPPPHDLFAFDAASGVLAQLTDSQLTSSRVEGSRYSPDGSKIAFFAAGGIWVMDADGSNRLQLTTDDGTDPVFTPDGRWVAYLKSDGVVAGSGGIYFTRANGSGAPVRVPNTTSRDRSSDVAPSIDCAGVAPVARTPGCYRVAINRITIGSNTSTIVSLDGSGNGLTTLVGPAAFYASPRFSPDGTRLAYDQYLPPSRRVVHVLALDEPGAIPEAISSGADDYAQSPIWSPDGKVVLFTQAYTDPTRDFIYDRDVWVTDANGCGTRPLYANTSTYDYSLDWKPGAVAGQGLGGISGRIFIANLYPQSAIAGALVELSGGATATTTTDAEGNFAFENLPAGGNFTVRALSAPGFVADPNAGGSFGGVETFTNLRGYAANLSLFLWPADSTLSGAVNRVSDQGVFVPVAGVLVQVEGPGGPFEATTGSDGRFEFTVQRFQNYTVTPSKPGLVFDPPSSSSFGSIGFRAFDRVPTRIAFVSGRDGNDEIYAADADGRNAANVTQDPAADRDPSWSPDGLRIAFTSDRDGGAAMLHVMDADGGYVESLFEAGREPAWSPDGTRLVYATDSGLRSLDLTTGIVTDTTYDASDASPAFRRDGSGVAFARTVEGDTGIWELEFDSGFASERIGSAGFDGDPAFCAANDSFAYATQYGDDTAPIQILAQYPSGGVFANGRHPSWSTDCAELAYDDGAGSILRTDPRTFDTPLVISAQADRDPAWQPKTNDLPACSNGVDDDGDGFIDYPEDPGCPSAISRPENPECDDGVDNDGDGLTDFADAKCTPSWPYWEHAVSCGLGAELVLVLPVIAGWRRRARRSNRVCPPNPKY